MKIRNGFVSNSSSSSFVLVAENDQWEECLNECPEVINYLISSGRVVEVFGKKLVVITGYESTEDAGWKLEDWYGDYVGSNGKIIKKPDDDNFDWMDFQDEYDPICFEEEAINFVCKKMNEKKYEYIKDSISC